MNAYRLPSPFRRGFTLIELLVVVSILSVLIAILLPSLGRARAQAKQAACGANLHGIGLAMGAYASEFNRSWPAPGCADPGGGGDPKIPSGSTVADKQGNFSWIANFLYPRMYGQQLDPAVYPYVYYDPAATGLTQAAWDYYNKGKKHEYLVRTGFICPAASFSDAASVPGAEVITGGYFEDGNFKALSYGMSARINSAENGPQSSVVTFKYESKVKSPQMTALVADSSQPWVGTLIGAPANINVQLNFLQAGAIRHLTGRAATAALGGNSATNTGTTQNIGRPNFLMCDYHVEAIQYRDIPNYATTTAASAAANGSQWYQFWFGDR